MYFKEPSTWRWLLMMFGGAVLCMGLFVVGIDEMCHRDIVDQGRQGHRDRKSVV